VPILHIQHAGDATAPDGSPVKVQPSVVMQLTGPCIQVLIGLASSMVQTLTQNGQTVPTPRAGRALIDTGAAITCIDDDLARNLGLPVLDVVQMVSASHTTPANVYPVQIEVVGVGINVQVLKCMGAKLSSQGIEALIGRDFLANGLLVYNGVVGAITLSF
jgi:predicted aspartyl protease